MWHITHRRSGSVAVMVLACLALGACGSKLRFSEAELTDMTRCVGGTVFPGRQSDRHASYTRACESAYGKLRISEFEDDQARDAYLAGEVINHITGRKADYAFFVYGNGWAIACQSRTSQEKVADVTGGEAAPS